MNGTGLRIFILRDFFLKYTDEEHPATVQAMLAHLAGHGVHPERRTVYADIRLLRRAGMDIVRRQTRTSEYYLASREFELAELKLLVDAVQSCRFLSERKSAELIGKLESLASGPAAKRLSHEVFVENRVKTGNERVYYNVDSIHAATERAKKIGFLYCQYTMEKRLVPKRGGALYVVSPYLLAYAEDNYYLIGDSPHHPGLAHYRVDKMTEVRLLDVPRDPLAPLFDPVAYAKSMFSMYAGEREWVEMTFDESLVGVVIDRFGADVPIVPGDDGRFSVRAFVSVSPAFFGWLLQFGGKAAITRPDAVRQRMLAQLSASAASYR